MKIFAWDKSRETSTAEIVTWGKRGSRISRDKISASSLRICSPTRRGLENSRVFTRFDSVGISSRSCDLHFFEHLYLISHFYVIVVLHTDTALSTGLNIGHVISEASKRFKFTFVNYDAVS